MERKAFLSPDSISICRFQAHGGLKMGVEKAPQYDIPTVKVDYVFLELDKMKLHEQLVQ